MAFLPKICQFHYQDLVLDNERITWIATDSSVRGWYKYTVLWSTNWRGNCRYLQPEDLNITMTPHRFPWGHDQIISTSASSSSCVAKITRLVGNNRVYTTYRPYYYLHQSGNGAHCFTFTFNTILTRQRWEDCENQFHEKHLLDPADPQEALGLLDLSQQVPPLKANSLSMFRIKEAFASPSSPSTAPARRRGFFKGHIQ